VYVEMPRILLGLVLVFTLVSQSEEKVSKDEKSKSK